MRNKVNNITPNGLSTFICSTKNHSDICANIFCRTILRIERFCETVFNLCDSYRSCINRTPFNICASNQSVIFIIVSVCTPFKVVDIVVCLAFIFMINAWIIMIVFKKSFCYKSMNVVSSLLTIFSEIYNKVSIVCKYGMKETSFKSSNIRASLALCPSDCGVWESFYVPKITYLIQSFVPFNVFPNFLFHNNKIIGNFQNASAYLRKSTRYQYAFIYEPSRSGYIIMAQR